MDLDHQMLEIREQYDNSCMLSIPLWVATAVLNAIYTSTWRRRDIDRSHHYKVLTEHSLGTSSL